MRSSARLGIALLTGVVAGLLAGLLWAWPVAALIGWDVGVISWSIWAWVIMIASDAKTTAAHATREDPGRAESDLIVLIASMASLIAVGFVLARANGASGGVQNQLAALGVLSVAASWFAVHTLFALRYARLYYTGPDGGIEFNQHLPPRYLDFAYVAFTIGMTFQVSDTDLQDPAIRSTALRQGLIGYLFGAVILAATVNLLASLVTSR